MIFLHAVALVDIGHTMLTQFLCNENRLGESIELMRLVFVDLKKLIPIILEPLIEFMIRLDPSPIPLHGISVLPSYGIMEIALMQLAVF